MPVDEFGREVKNTDNNYYGPTSSNISDHGNNSRFRHDNDDDHPYQQRDFHEASSSSRMNSDNYGGSGGSRDYSPSRSGHHYDDNRNRSSSASNRYDGGGSGSNKSYSNNRYNQSSSYSGGGGRGFSRSSPRRSYNRRDGGSGPRRGGGRGQQQAIKKMPAAYASTRYNPDPLLCQFLWDSKNQEDQQNENKNADASNKSTQKGEDNDESKDNEPVDQKTTPTNGEEIVANASTASAGTSYENYKEQYCLKYVRQFFNSHIDDTWFKNKYSPLHIKNFVVSEKERSQNESKVLVDSITGVTGKDKDTTNNKKKFIKNARLGYGEKVSSSTTPASATMSSALSTPRDTPDNKLRIPMSHMFEFKSDSMIIVQDIPSHVTDDQLIQSLVDHFDVKQYHIDIKNKNSKSSDNKGEENNNKAVTNGKVNVIHSLYNTSVKSSPETPSNHFLDRDCYVYFESRDIKDNVLTNLTKANIEARRIPGKIQEETSSSSSAGAKRGSIAVPRKHDSGANAVPMLLDLDVDCSDPYGRMEIDDDGKGGAPAPISKSKDRKRNRDGGLDSHRRNTNDDDEDEIPTISVKKCTVIIVTHPERDIHDKQPVSVLSAAVSSKERISRDKDSAVMLGRALDVLQGIPRGYRLDDLLEALFSDSSTSEDDNSNKKNDDGNDDTNDARNAEKQREEDILDVSIAYLRRVHLFSFYNGCTKSEYGIGDVLSGQHASGTVFLRLRNADDILRKASEETGELYDDLDEEEGQADDTNKEQSKSLSSSSSTDLLVMRHNNSISKALEQSTEWVTRAGMYVVDAEIDKHAKEIEHQEENKKQEWIAKHCIIDGDDGRARCAFHFCKKLFKDSNFLRKHLLKKHVEFLRAEVATCHDTYMMKAWDNECSRPVPPIFVDCGTNFGLVPTLVTAGIDDPTKPTASDPEPELWRKEEERRKRLDEMSADENSSNNRSGGGYNNRDTYSSGGGGTGGDTGGGDKRMSGGKSNFVDVDDVHVEKVELKFENVEVPKAMPLKKKKKRRKLL